MTDHESRRRAIWAVILLDVLALLAVAGCVHWWAA